MQAANLAFVFPGQGSQSLGMLAELGSEFAVVKSTFDEASAGAGVDLWALSQNGPEAELNRTENTQPALLAADVAVWRVWHERRGATPAMLAGHSLGEYAALVCAGVLGLRDAAALVAERGRLMQSAVPPGVGAMAAILGGDDAQIAQVCVEVAQGEVVAPVNYNAPGQLVSAGNAAQGVALAAQDEEFAELAVEDGGAGAVGVGGERGDLGAGEAAQVGTGVGLEDQIHGVRTPLMQIR